MWAVKAQVKAVGGSLDPLYVKRCDSCSARQYTNLNTCRFCGGRCRRFDTAGGTAVPIVLMVDPVTGELTRFVMGADGQLVRLGPTAETIRRSREKAEIENINSIIGHAKAFELDHALVAITRLADLVDPNREIVAKEKIPFGSSTTADLEGLNRRQLIEDALQSAVESVQCAVCLTEYRSPITLPCGHSLCCSHVGEIGTKCPICRVELPKPLWKKITTKPPTNDSINEYIEIVQTLGNVARNKL